ncbi:MAG: sulfurtransferase complex subunit TusD [Pseudomonadota bacterium]|nr:sulfurtransferase complex subunit TusD [Pseudomonadota bacterium]
MIFSVSVLGSPYATAAHVHAQDFCRACLSTGHSVARVFFYHDAVYAALRSRVPPQDETDFTLAWQRLAQEHGFELAVCIANGLKRGVVDGAEADRYEINTDTLSDGFTLVGLGQLVDAIANSDRHVEFPA